MGMATVYVETTIPSYLAANPSRDLLTAAHQEVTWRWWETARERFDLYISETVLDEIAAGDPDAGERRKKIITGLPVLAVDDRVRKLARTYRDKLGLPKDSEADALHIALCVAHEMDYLVTWNCGHLANGKVIRRLQELNLGMKLFNPLMVTPEELLDDE